MPEVRTDVKASKSRIGPVALPSAVVLLLAALAGVQFYPLFSSSQPALVEGYNYCREQTFSHHTIAGIRGVERISIQASPVFNSSGTLPPFYHVAVDNSKPFFKPQTAGVSFCNVTVSYSTPGYGNRVNVYVYLPTKGVWNGRFQGTGGGSFWAGLGDMALLPAVATGWAAATTDGGLYPPQSPLAGDPSSWATTAEGVVNWNAIYMFGPGAIEDMTRIGQAVTRRYYGVPAAKLKSYFNGCSTGGRQGLMLAQRAPELYHGILAGAPVVDYNSLLPGDYHPQYLMTVNKTWPQPCELDFITRAAIAECDPLDGVTDGLISNPENCPFSPLPLINTTIPCASHPHNTTTLSAFAAHLALETWAGPYSPSHQLLHQGLAQEASLLTIANTKCTYNSTTGTPTCENAPLIVSAMFFNSWIYAHHPNPNPSTLTSPQPQPAPTIFPNLTPHTYHALFTTAHAHYASLIAATNPDLSAFARAPSRPKMITWHGLADSVIASNHSLDYYKAVRAHFAAHKADYGVADAGSGSGSGSNGKSVSAVSDFFRYFSVPGVEHCGAGPGPYPGKATDSCGALDELVAWVEGDHKAAGKGADMATGTGQGTGQGGGTVERTEGKPPAWLLGVSDVREDLLGKSADGRARRPLCAWPGRAIWEGKESDWWEMNGWRCVGGEDDRV